MVSGWIESKIADYLGRLGDCEAGNEFDTNVE